MIIGNENLKDLFPEFEDCIKENGLDTNARENRKAISKLQKENNQLQQIMKDIVMVTDETYTKNASIFKVTVVLDFEKYMEIRRCIK